MIRSCEYDGTSQRLGAHMKRFVNTLSWFWLVAGVSIGLLILLLPSGNSDSNLPELTTVRADAKPMAREYETRPIETLRVGDRVLAWNPDITDEEREEFLEPDWSSWHRASLEMVRPDESVLQIEMIRPREWFQENDVAPGKMVFVDLPEMGAEGDARVLSTGECPPVRSGVGNVVTATFAHPPDEQVLNVLFEGESQPIGVTENHLFWSVDQLMFVPIGELPVGERTQSYSGQTKRILQKLPLSGPQLVYNLEVYPEHVYFVGEQGILAHNEYLYAVRVKATGEILYVGKGTLGRTKTAVQRISSFTGIAKSKLEMVKVNVGKSEFIMRGMEQRALLHLKGQQRVFSARGQAYVKNSGNLANVQLSFSPKRLSLPKNTTSYQRAKAFQDAGNAAANAHLWTQIKTTFGLK